MACGSSRRFCQWCAVLLLLVSAGTRRIEAVDDSVTVNDTRDFIDPSPNIGDCSSTVNTCTLRAAIMRANHRVGTHTIRLPAGTFILTIIGRNEDNAEQGDLDIKGNIVIIGAGAKLTTIVSGPTPGFGIDRVFDVHSGTLFLQDVAITNGLTQAGEEGSGIRAKAPLSLNRVLLANNTAPTGIGARGGGIFTDSDLSVVRSALVRNQAVAGGAIFARRDNIITNADISIRESTFSGNVDVGNVPDPIVDIFGQFDVVVSHATIARNTGGGLGMTDLGLGAASLEVRDTILAENSADNCDVDNFSFIVTAFNNNDSDGSCGFSTVADNLILVEPQLSSLTDNGGQTPTHVFNNNLLADHTAVCSGVDQRGFARPVNLDNVPGGGCDIGAIEKQGLIGIAVLDPENATVKRDADFVVSYLWRVPPGPLQDWRDLASLDLRIVEPQKEKKDNEKKKHERTDEVVFWLRWHENAAPAPGTFELIDPASGLPYGPAVAVGSKNILETDAVRLDVKRSSETGSGPTGLEVTLRLALRFLEKSKKDGPFVIEVTAEDDLGQTQPFLALGSVSVETGKGKDH